MASLTMKTLICLVLAASLSAGSQPKPHPDTVKPLPEDPWQPNPHNTWNPDKSPKNYTYVDHIERDEMVNCYHLPLLGHKGAPVGYRKCYFKKEPCNVRWREHVLRYRRNCMGEWRHYDWLCMRIWEPDIESENYCAGKEVKEDGKGNRIPPCGAPAGIGEGALCPLPNQGPCYDEKECRLIEPDAVHSPGKECRGVWSHCEQTFVRVCQAFRMPCQDNCGHDNTCVHGLPAGVPVQHSAVVDWDAVKDIDIAAVAYDISFSAANSNGNQMRWVEPGWDWEEADGDDLATAETEDFEENADEAE